MHRWLVATFKKNKKTRCQELEEGTGMRGSEESWTELLQHEVPHNVQGRIPHDPPWEEDGVKDAQSGEKTIVALS